jgi:hypothetical protein
MAAARRRGRGDLSRGDWASARLAPAAQVTAKTAPARRRLWPGRMRPCRVRRSHLRRVKFIPTAWYGRNPIDVVGPSGPKPDRKNKSAKGRCNMIKTLVGAAAVAAIACAFVPAQAARVGLGCSGDNLGKTEGTVEGMADTPAKFMAQREIAQAQDAMLKGDMRGCSVHLSRAANAGKLAPTPYGTTTQGFAQAPAQAQYPAQPQWGWQQPAQSGY